MDAVATDAMYHPSCYKEFTDSCALNKLEDTAEEMGDSYAQAYGQLFAEVESSVLTGKKLSSCLGCVLVLFLYWLILASTMKTIRQRRSNDIFGNGLEIG